MSRHGSTASPKADRRPVHLLQLQNVPILEQLRIEEALLRADDRDWCITNFGSTPAIVMGISGKQDELVHEANRSACNLPVIRRFSGGGTVVVDESTCFATFIFNSTTLSIDPFPQPIMRWTEDFYRPLFHPKEFLLRENDYVFGERKFGGNAQYLAKGRWLHHSSFLWDYDHRKMSALAIPKRTPAYRRDRPHEEFICKLKEEISGVTLDKFAESIGCRLATLFSVVPVSIDEMGDILGKPHRKSTRVE